MHDTGSEMYHLVHVLVTEVSYPINRSSILSKSCIYQCKSFRNKSTSCYSPLIITSQGVSAQQRMPHKCK